MEPNLNPPALTHEQLLEILEELLFTDKDFSDIDAVVYHELMFFESQTS